MSRPFRDCVNFGVTMPRTLYTDLNKLRGDVPRSTYLRRIVEREIADKLQQQRQHSEITVTN